MNTLRFEEWAWYRQLNNFEHHSKVRWSLGCLSNAMKEYYAKDKELFNYFMLRMYGKKPSS